MIKMLQDYEINSDTLAILPYQCEYAKVLELNNQYYVKKTPKSIISDSCKYYGSSYQGRVEGSRTLVGFYYKSPIIIEESIPMIFFPTESPRHESCSWINLSNVVGCESYFGGSLLEFKNGSTIPLNISKTSLQNQVYRASRLSERLNDRKILKK